MSSPLQALFKIRKGLKYTSNLHRVMNAAGWEAVGYGKETEMVLSISH